MNINFNKLFQRFLPFIYIVLAAYLFGVAIFLYLPKSGVSFVENSSMNLEYKKYSFYSDVKQVQEKNTQENKSLQTLEKYDLKAIYYTSLNNGWITIEEKSGTQSHILAHGEQIDDYTLFKLFKNHVLFQKNNKEYKLEIKEKEITNFNTDNQETKDIEVKSNGAVVNRNYLNSYVTNIDKIWNNIAISEIKNKNKIEGFKINKINKDSVFAKLGLKEGDIIKAVNNNVLNSYAEAFKIYNNINNTSYLNIEILRNNELMELNYEID